MTPPIQKEEDLIPLVEGSLGLAAERLGEVGAHSSVAPVPEVDKGDRRERRAAEAVGKQDRPLRWEAR